MLIQLQIREALALIKYSMVKIRRIFTMAKIKITQVKSKIGSTLRQKRTLEALGLKKVDGTVELESTPQILGMVNKVRHLITVQEL